MRILFCGDVMPGGVLPYQKEYITKGLSDFMAGFDFRIGTLEAAIGTGLPFDEFKMQKRCNIVYARNEDFFRVKELGFDVVSLANNHVFDLGVEGLQNTIDILKKNGIAYCGAGMDIEEASRPAVLNHCGKTIAILSYCMYGNVYLGHVELAGKDKPGINPLDIDKVVSDIKRYKQQYDYVVVMPHWGREYTYAPMTECIQMAYDMVDAGADLIVGSHTHCAQPLIRYKKKNICFSLGNFLFPDFYMYPPRPIWYPESDVNLSAIPDVIGYPFPIDKPMRQVWNEHSRIGLTVSCTWNNGNIRCRRKYIRSSVDNVINLYSPSLSYRLRLIMYTVFIKMPLLKNIVVSLRSINNK